MGVIMGRVSVVEKVKYDCWVKAVTTAPVGVDGLVCVSTDGFMSSLSHFSECSLHDHVLSLVCFFLLIFLYYHEASWLSCTLFPKSPVLLRAVSKIEAKTQLLAFLVFEVPLYVVSPDPTTV